MKLHVFVRRDFWVSAPACLGPLPWTACPGLPPVPQLAASQLAASQLAATTSLSAL